MRMLIFFDLPVKTKKERREATQFRKFLLKDGYHMVQYSVYARVCNGSDSVLTHERRLKYNLPSKGSIKLLTVTERQYDSVRVLVGDISTAETRIASDQINFF